MWAEELNPIVTIPAGFFSYSPPTPDASLHQNLSVLARFWWDEELMQQVEIHKQVHPERILLTDSPRTLFVNDDFQSMDEWETQAHEIVAGFQDGLDSDRQKLDAIEVGAGDGTGPRAFQAENLSLARTLIDAMLENLCVTSRLSRAIAKHQTDTCCMILSIWLVRMRESKMNCRAPSIDTRSSRECAQTFPSSDRQISSFPIAGQLFRAYGTTWMRKKSCLGH